MAQRNGYTVTMFLVDVSKSMGKTRTVQLPDGPNGEERTIEMTNLQWSLQYAKLKIQDMIYNARKTDQCGVVLFGTEGTDNIIHERAKGEGYENVTEYLPIEHPTASTLAKLDELEPSDTTGDPIDGIIVASTVQSEYLGNKKTWTRKLVILTDAESPMELEDWEATADKLNEWNVEVTVVGADFDSDEEDFPFEQEDKPEMKRINEGWYHEFVNHLDNANLGTCEYVLQEINKPDMKLSKSVLMRGMLRLGDCDTRPEEAIALLIRTSKCTAATRPASWSKYGIVPKEEVEDDVSVYVPLKMNSEYYIDKGERDKDGDVKMEEEDEKEKDPLKDMEIVEKETLVRGYKYGTTYVPCPDGEFEKLPTKAGLEICGFFNRKHFRRELSMGEIQYVWADPDMANQQVAMSSIVRAMAAKKVYAIGRWVTKDERAPKMGVLAPVQFDEVDCLTWAPMPFADDVRKYGFPSLDHLLNKKGEVVKEHPYVPTEDQRTAMDNFVDAMDLMEAGDKDENGDRGVWFDTRDSFNPALHRVKQAMFHSAVVNDLDANPLPPPHPEIVKYFQPPRRMLKRAHDSIEACKDAFKVREVPKKVAKIKKDGHAHAREDDDEVLLLDKVGPAKPKPSSSKVKQEPEPKPTVEADGSETEEDDDDELLLDKVSKPPAPASKAGLLTPARSLSPVEVDRGVEEGRIIGTTYPLEDFNKNLEAKDLVTRAVSDLAYVVGKIVAGPFASRRHAEMIECMRKMRETCLEEDEIEAWNEFLVDLKAKCTKGNGNKDFWDELRAIGREISLISEAEAEKNGGESDYSESKAKKFFI